MISAANNQLFNYTTLQRYSYAETRSSSLAQG